MSAGTREPSSAAPPLEVVVAGNRIRLSAGRPFVLGRGPDCDYDVDHPRASRRHLVLEAGNGSWQATDTSRNGTFRGGTRLASSTPVPITGPTTLTLGDASDGVTVELRPGEATVELSDLSAAGQGRLSTVQHIRRDTIRIGRNPDCDLVLSDDLLVSRRHCELHRGPMGWTVTDLSSPNGTFLNGRRITTAPIREGDVLGVGRTLLQLRGDELIAFTDVGANSFETEGLTVTTAQGRRLLAGIGFSLQANSLLGVIGPSGAGKSTLLNAMIGTRPADQGTVRYAGRDLYEDYEELRHRIALVPQDDVLHTQLTVRQALTYAARLRFPADTSPADRDRRIDEVLTELGLTGHAEQRVDSLSGGQRKRTSVALELLTKPSLLFLDEPTSGLDPGMDRTVMQTLRTLADDGRTVVVVTHSVTNLSLCDQILVLAPGGHVAYFGPPDDALRYFGRRDFTDIFLALSQEPGELWADRFRRSGLPGSTPPQPRISAPIRVAEPAAPPPRQQGVWTQFSVLVRRYLAVIASDKQYVGFLLALPLVLSALARAVPGSAGISVNAALPTLDPQPQTLLLILVIGASLMGAAASMRELVKERPIYLRERAIGLSLRAYLGSKLVVLAVIAGLQATVFTLLALLGRTGPDQTLVIGSGRTEVLLAVLAVAVASMLTGLVISAVVSNADRGMPLLVVLIMVQLILCGGLFAVYDRPVLEQLSWLVPAKWGFSMTAATADVNRLNPPPPDPTWEHALDTWWTDALWLGVLGLVLTVVTVVLVKRLDPKRRTSR